MLRTSVHAANQCPWAEPDLSTVANCHGRVPSECRKHGCTDDRKGQFRVGSKLIMIKTRGSWRGGASLLPHLAERPACSPNSAVSSAAAFSCWLLYVVQKSEPWSGKCVLPISELRCFIVFQKRCMFYNPVHSIRDSGVAMPAAESVFIILGIFTTRSRGR